jgi:hypothetical protein
VRVDDEGPFQLCGTTISEKAPSFSKASTASNVSAARVDAGAA